MTQLSNHSAESHRGRIRHYAAVTAKVLGALLLLALLVHVSWNMFAPDMFGLGAIRMKQAIGIVVFAGVFAFLFRAGRHRAGDHAAEEA